jgi:hypothetical protein
MRTPYAGGEGGSVAAEERDSKETTQRVQITFNNADSRKGRMGN